MTTKKKDTRGRNLKVGEDQMPEGRYRYRYIDNSGKRRTIYSWRLTPTDAEPIGKRNDLSLREKRGKIEQEQLIGINSQVAAKMTLNDMFDHYMLLKKGELKESSRNNYLYMWNRYVKEDLGNWPLDRIKNSTIKSFYNSLLEKGFKTNSLNVIHTIVHPTLTLAVNDDIIRRNPSDGVMRELVRTPSNERQALTIEQQRAFVRYVSNSKTYRSWLSLFIVFLGTGMRVSEVIGLTWNNVDFKNNIIIVDHSLIYRMYDGVCGFHITTPKTNKGIRSIPMLSEVRKYLLEQKQWQTFNGFGQCEVEGVSNFVFTNRFDRPHNPMTINRTIKKIYMEYNEEETRLAAKEHRSPILLPHFSVHIFRHTFCTRFCENESNVKAIQEIMGHSDISTTLGIYTHITAQKAKEVMGNLDKKIAHF